MAELTKKQIEEWKDKYFSVFQITGEKGEVGYLQFPDWLDWVKASKALEISPSKFVESYLNDCWLQGDESLKDNFPYFQKLKKQINKELNFADATLVKVENHFEIRLKGGASFEKAKGKELAVKVKPLSRDMLNEAEENSEDKPYAKLESILELILMPAGKKVMEEHFPDKNPYWYFPLLTKCEEVYDKKKLTVKKLF